MAAFRSARPIEPPRLVPDPPVRAPGRGSVLGAVQESGSWLERISGEVAAGFEPVADAFAANFDAPGEDAAALAIYHDGVAVVDLWGGTDVVYDRPMPADGLMMVASCSKGVTATVLAMLVERGRLDPERPVADYWPEFAAAGKAETTVAMVASHTAGLPYPPLGTGLHGLRPASRSGGHPGAGRGSAALALRARRWPTTRSPTAPCSTRSSAGRPVRASPPTCAH